MLHDIISSHVYSNSSCPTSSLSSLELAVPWTCPGSWSQRFGAERKDASWRVFCASYVSSEYLWVPSSWKGAWYFRVWHFSDSKSLFLSTLPWTLLKPFCSKSSTKYRTAGFDWRLVLPSHGKSEKHSTLHPQWQWNHYCPTPGNLPPKRKERQKTACLWKEWEVEFWGIPSSPLSCW